MALLRIQREYILSATTKNSSKWYASIRYFDSDMQWRVVMRDWDTWAPIAFTDLRKPPKEYVESLVLLAFNIGDKDD
jgi:uncharacterized protein (DUF1684 family)